MEGKGEDERGREWRGLNRRAECVWNRRGGDRIRGGVTCGLANRKVNGLRCKLGSQWMERGDARCGEGRGREGGGNVISEGFKKLQHLDLRLKKEDWRREYGEI